MSKKTTRPLILYAVEPCTYIIPDIKETTAAADMTQCAFFCIFFCRNLHFMWFGAPRNVWDYKSQVWNNSSDVTTDKTHYVMTVWLVFWSKRVWNALIRPSPVIGGRSGGGRDAIHTVTPYHQNDFNIYKESPSCLFDSQHHMNALWLSVTSRETKTKCFHRERTVKLEEEEKKKEGQTHPVVAPHSSGITSEERDIIFASLTMDFCRRKRRSALRLRESERFIHEVRGVDIKRRRLIVMFHPRE